MRRFFKFLYWGLTFQLRRRLRERNLARRIRESGLFDSSYYLSNNPDVRDKQLDPVLHYIRHGAAEGRNPNPVFDTQYYLENNPDVATAKTNPLLHFVEWGANEGRNPNPMFDTRFYLSANPFVADNGLNPLRHYLEVGAASGRDPSRAFATDGYLKANPDVARSGLNPLVHYLATGGKEGRDPRGVDKEVATNPAADKPESQELDTPDSAQQLIAFYLPQYHPIPENDEWWGPGFTEWRNVTRAKPLYPGHDQPKLPSDLGFYDLRVRETKEAQARLAREYGITGFCYYYYWFDGRRLLERPLDDVLTSGSPDFPFCICWANENWTRRWDGMDDEILIAQQHSLASDYRFIEEVIPILKNPNYITRNGEPVLLVYRPDLLQDSNETAALWRDACVQAGLPGVHLCSAQFTARDPRSIGFDAAVEFPPHTFEAPEIPPEELGAFEGFEGAIRCYSRGVENALGKPNSDFSVYRCVMPAWDNTARRGSRATIFHEASPANYELWLGHVVEEARKIGPEQFVFVNAWNEWAEGAYLEPDHVHGRAYLEATRRAVEGKRNDTEPGADWEFAPAGDSPQRYEGPPVLIVSHDAAHAGSQFVLLELLKSLRRIGDLEPYVVFLEGGVLEAQIREIAPCINLEHCAPESVSNALDRAIASLKGRGLSLAVCNTVVTSRAVEGCKRAGLSVVSLVHEQPHSIDSMFGGRETMDRIAQNADRIVTVSEFARTALIDAYSVDPDKLGVIRPPVRELKVGAVSRIGARERILDELGFSSSTCLVLGCGTVYHRKGPDLFVDVAHRVLQDPLGGHCRFVWVGAAQVASYQDALDQEIKERGLEREVRFVGHTPDVEVFFRAADVFALTSREDPFPLVNLEAMAFGLPVVSFAGTGGAPEVIGDDAGLVVPHLSVQDMADAVVGLAGDEALRERLGGRAARKIREDYEPDRYARDLLQLIRRECGVGERAAL